jgi:hypothetical protein
MSFLIDIDHDEDDDDDVSSCGIIDDIDSVNAWTIVSHVPDDKDSFALSVLLADLTGSFSGWSSAEETIISSDDYLGEPEDIPDDISLDICPTISTMDSYDTMDEGFVTTERKSPTNLTFYFQKKRVYTEPSIKRSIEGKWTVEDRQTRNLGTWLYLIFRDSVKEWTGR